MTMFTRLLTAAAVFGGVAVPAAAQDPQPGYGQPGYGYQDPNGLGAIIGQLLGNRYNVTDRTAVQQCASAAMRQAAAQYRPQNAYGQPPYGNAYGYNNNRGYQQGYAPNMRVTAITNVASRINVLNTVVNA